MAYPHVDRSVTDENKVIFFSKIRILLNEANFIFKISNFMIKSTFFSFSAPFTPPCDLIGLLGLVWSG